MTTTIPLHPWYFTQKETTIVEHGSLSATAFRYESGVAGVRLCNERGEFVVLPFQGQQIWSARFDGRDLAMRSLFDQPRETQIYLQNYGAFLLHCGVLSMGVPGEGDDHPLHGELPNAPFQRAYLRTGEDASGPFLTIGGRYEHLVAFGPGYVAEPQVTMRAGSALLDVHVQVTNLKQTPMDLMYMAHMNFRPVNGGELVYSAQATPEHVRVRYSIPSHVTPDPGYKDFLDTLSSDPSMHHTLSDDLSFDPEVVFYIDYEADGDGWAHTMQVHPDGSADYAAHRPEQLGHGVRWIYRAADQDALGMVLPATAEPEGYSAEKAKGNLYTLAGKAVWQASMRVGVLTAEETMAIEKTIQETITQGSTEEG